MFRESAAAICLQGAGGDEMLILMKWDCSVLSFTAVNVANSDTCYHYGYHAWEAAGFVGSIDNT